MAQEACSFTSHKAGIPSLGLASADRHALVALYLWCPLSLSPSNHGREEHGRDTGLMGNFFSLLATPGLCVAFSVARSHCGSSAHPPIRCAGLRATSSEHVQTNLLSKVFLPASKSLGSWDYPPGNDQNLPAILTALTQSSLTLSPGLRALEMEKLRQIDVQSLGPTARKGSGGRETQAAQA